MKILYLLLQLAGVFVILSTVPFLLGPESLYTFYALIGLIIGIALLIFGGLRYRRERKKMPTATGGPFLLRRSIITATLLFIVDAFILDQGFITLLVMAVAVFVYLPGALLARKNKEVSKSRFIRAIIYLIMTAAVFSVISFNSWVARDRADELISKCGQFKAKYQKYPALLEDLTPEFMPKIRPAKYTLLSGKFLYRYNDGQPSLMYIATPPFGRNVYSFQQSQWSVID